MSCLRKTTGRALRRIPRPGLPTTSPMTRMFIGNRCGDGQTVRRVFQATLRPPGGQMLEFRPTLPPRGVMPLALPEPLLALASGVGAAGGGAVLSVLQAILADAAPFDLAEVALRRGSASERFGLGPAREAAFFTADDVLDRVMADGAALRLDDLGEAD